MTVTADSTRRSVLTPLDGLATVSPYITHAIRRFGDFALDLTSPRQEPATRLGLEPEVLVPGGV
ncbi:hypothetical protein ACIQVA_39025 [Streptomyces microflavus]|uniref:hypothetical protein n=1 Tax=Streptomyces microflavus TaxID=1919 RepID=UPI0038291541